MSTTEPESQVPRSRSNRPTAHRWFALNLFVFGFGTLGACSVETPCPSGQRLAENQRDGAIIRYCVSLADGKAYGDFSCRHPDGRTVTGEFDRNRKTGTWRYAHRAGALVRVERWARGELLEVERYREGELPPLGCGKEVIVEPPPAALPLDRGWSTEGKLARRLYPGSDATWMEGRYEDGRKSGEWKYYRRSGTLHVRGHYRRGLADGEWVRFDRQGRPAARARYVRGKRLRGPDLVWDAASVRGMVSPDPSELSRHEVRRALEEALH